MTTPFVHTGTNAQRVQIPAYTDRWMMGDRYGEIVKVYTNVKGEIAVVKLDKSGLRRYFLLSDCQVL